MKKLFAWLSLISLTLSMTGFIGMSPAWAYPAETKIVATGTTKNVNVSRSLSFDGLGDIVTQTNTLVGSGVNSSTTMYVEFKTTSSTPSTFQTIAQWGEGLQSARFGAQLDSTNRFNVGFFNGAAYTNKRTESLSVNTWHTAIYTWNGTSATLVVDNADQTATSGAPQTDSSNKLTVGSRPSVQSLQGNINRYILWNRVLSSDEKLNLQRGIFPQQNKLIDWSFDSLSTTTAYDTSGNGNNGTITGATVSTDVPSNASPSEPLVKTKVSNVSRSALFSASNSIITTPSGIVTNLSSTSYSFSAWVKAPLNSSNVASDQQSVFGTGNTAGTTFSYIYITLRNSNYIFRYQDGGEDIQSTSPQIPGKWTHLVATIDNSDSKQRLYVNGVLRDTDTITSILNTTSSLLMIGQVTTGQSYVNGTIDDVRVWRGKALSTSEVANLYANRNIPQDGLVGEWNMDEASGNTFNDTSGNGNTGTGTNVTRDYSVPQ